MGILYLGVSKNMNIHSAGKRVHTAKFILLSAIPVVQQCRAVPFYYSHHLQLRFITKSTGFAKWFVLFAVALGLYL